MAGSHRAAAGHERAGLNLAASAASAGAASSPAMACGSAAIPVSRAIAASLGCERGRSFGASLV